MIKAFTTTQGKRMFQNRLYYEKENGLNIRANMAEFRNAGEILKKLFSGEKNLVSVFNSNRFQSITE